MQSVLQGQLQGDALQQAGAGGQIHQEVQITVGSGLITGHGPERRQIGGAVLRGDLPDPWSLSQQVVEAHGSPEAMGSLSEAAQLGLPPRFMVTAGLRSNEKGAPCRAPLGRLQGLGSRCPGRGL
jgi:hypothetical protein